MIVKYAFTNNFTSESRNFNVGGGGAHDSQNLRAHTVAIFLTGPGGMVPLAPPRSATEFTERGIPEGCTHRNSGPLVPFCTYADFAVSKNLNLNHL